MSQPSSPPSSLAARPTSSDPADWSLAQLQRRRRILGAALELATVGGFDAVQMRVVADQAGVALGTLYRYFPSKIHLLVAVLVDELSNVVEAIKHQGIAGTTAADRVTHLADQNVRAQLTRPQLHSALLRAYVFANTSSADNAQVSALSRAIICRAIQSGRQPAPDDADIAGVLSDVWLSASVGWIAGRLSPDDVRMRMQRAARLLLHD